MIWALIVVALLYTLFMVIVFARVFRQETGQDSHGKYMGER